MVFKAVIEYKDYTTKEHRVLTFVDSQFDRILLDIREHFAYWNNFTAVEPIKITIEKVKDNTPTLGVHTGDVVQVKDIFGKR